ncbi:TIGR00297 family protein [Microcystis aeruginosa CS-555/01A07]|uniref:TIGR00297 family protein n=1 Tax=Microcystis aeruginosa TaxID=1126 RepID=UPI00232D4ED7|nr:TIGR00297 family protein [Microcystis aeruginosa]MDB9428902.1 TIGR00297 family protein [Microcystis aeruginosa CS-555/01A07]
MLTNPWLVAVLLNTILLGIAAIAPKKLLTRMGYLHAWVLGVIVWGSLGWRGYLIVLFYFLVGSTVTRIGLARKEAEGIAEKRAGVRGPENVWGSALAGAICAILSLFAASPWDYLLILAYVASFSTKLADTTASEVGKAYGKTTYLITNFKSVPRGTEGAVSLEGTLAGLLAATAISLLASTIGAIDLLGVLWCVIAAFIATNIESLIGATLQTRFLWLTNELVNVINTVIGAIVAIMLSLLWSFR